MTRTSSAAPTGATRTGASARGAVRRFAVVVVATLLAAGCGGGSGGAVAPPPPPGPSTVQSPTTINVYASAPSGEPPRIFVLLSGVGSHSVRLPVLLDSGSAGVTLNALAIFPSSMVTSNGFVFAAGQTSISYDGITVTSVQASRAYGGMLGNTQLGNVGYAEVVVGDAAGTLTTRSMPILFYYQVVSTATQQPVTGEGAQRGVFGVNDAPNLITVTGSAAPYPACAPGVTGSCWAVSPLKYLAYGSDVDAGFVIDPVTIESCDVGTDGDCTAQPKWVIGLTAASAHGFSLSALPCPPPSYTGPAVIEGYTVCQEKVPGMTLASSAPPAGSYTAAVIFDTGTPDDVLNVPTGTTFASTIPVGDSLEVTTPGGFVYTAASGTGLSAILVNPNVDATASVVGLGYFTTNSLYVDFSVGTEGWK